MQLLFTVEHPTTGSSFKFYGQGDSTAIAFAEGLENCRAPFRPKQDGRAQRPTTVIIKNKAGGRFPMTLAEWENYATESDTTASPHQQR